MEKTDVLEKTEIIPVEQIEKFKDDLSDITNFSELWETVFKPINELFEEIAGELSSNDLQTWWIDTASDNIKRLTDKTQQNYPLSKTVWKIPLVGNLLKWFSDTYHDKSYNAVCIQDRVSEIEKWFNYMKSKLWNSIKINTKLMNKSSNVWNQLLIYKEAISDKITQFEEEWLETWSAETFAMIKSWTNSMLTAIDEQLMMLWIQQKSIKNWLVWTTNLYNMMTAQWAWLKSDILSSYIMHQTDAIWEAAMDLMKSISKWRNEKIEFMTWKAIETSQKMDRITQEWLIDVDWTLSWLTKMGEMIDTYKVLSLDNPNKRDEVLLAIQEIKTIAETSLPQKS